MKTRWTEIPGLGCYVLKNIISPYNKYVRFVACDNFWLCILIRNTVMYGLLFYGNCGLISELSVLHKERDLTKMFQQRLIWASFLYFVHSEMKFTRRNNSSMNSFSSDSNMIDRSALRLWHIDLASSKAIFPLEEKDVKSEVVFGRLGLFSFGTCHTWYISPEGFS